MSLLGNPEFWKYLSIPFVAAFVGWSTNWLAVKMLFHPLQPVGRPPLLGWWGIIPSKAEKMGRITSRTTLSKLGSIEEIFDAMEPDRIAAYLTHVLRPRVEAYVDAVMMEENPTLWEVLPGLVKEVVYELVRDRLEPTVHDMILDIADEIGHMLDPEHLVVDRLVRDRRIVNRIFEQCGAEEFRFIVRSGIYFGFAFGVIQMLVWLVYPASWILPAFGLVVGYATNWIALRIVFQPLRPRRIGPFLVQGLFLRRQEEVSAIWCDIVTRDVLTVRTIIDELLHGPHAERTHFVVRRHIRLLIDEAIGIAKPLVQFTVGIQTYMHLKESASEKVIELTAEAFDDPAFNESQARKVKRMLQTRMEALSPEEFQYLLRPAFQEEELKLILVGAFLGLAAGLGQLFFVFGGW